MAYSIRGQRIAKIRPGSTGVVVMKREIDADNK